MVAKNNNLRNAAVLLARLDRELADLLLARLSRAEAHRIRAAVVELGEVSEDEEEIALEELIRQRPQARERESAGLDAAGLEIDDRLAKRLAASIRDEAQFDSRLSARERPSTSAAEDTPFRFLHEARMDELAERLGREHPQAIAVVLAYLPPARAAEALSALAEPVQVDVVRRLAAMEPADAVVVREIEDALRRWIAPAVEGGKPSVGMTAAQRILSATSGTTQRLVLDALAERDETLAERLGRAPRNPVVKHTSQRPAGPRQPQFSDVERLADGELARLWRTVDREVAVLALAAASEKFVDRVIEALDEPLAKAICRDLDELGSVALADLDAAQLEIATMAANMIHGTAMHTYNARAATDDAASIVDGGVVV